MICYKAYLQVESAWRKEGIRTRQSKMKAKSGGTFNQGKSSGSSFSINKGVNNRSGVLALN